MSKVLTAGPDLFAQLAASDPFARAQRRLFERGQVTAVEGNQVTVRVGYGRGMRRCCCRRCRCCPATTPRWGIG